MGNWDHLKRAGFDVRKIPKDEDVGVYLPSQEEIKAKCKEIQSGWDRYEEMHRRGVLVSDEGCWEVPECTVIVEDF